MKFFVGLCATGALLYFFLPELFFLLLSVAPVIIGILVFWAIVCYGIQMIRLFFKF